MAQSSQYIDENGYLLVKGCPVSSFGIFQYGAGQVGATGGDPMRIVNVYRPESAINDPELWESLKHVPLIDDHDYLVGNEDASDVSGMAPEEKGVDGITTDRVYYEKPWLRSDLKIFSRGLQQAIKKGKRDLSLGYTCTFEYAPGTYNGQSYEYVQTDMRCNHIALVDDARVPGARVLDGLVFDSMHFGAETPSVTRKESIPMENEEQTTQDGAADLLAQLQALLPQLEQALAAETGGAEGGEENAAPPAAEGGAEGGEGSVEGGAPATPEDEGGGTPPAPEGAEAPVAGEQAGAENQNPAAFDMESAIKMLDEILPKLKEKAGMGGAAAPAASAADNEETAQTEDESHELAVDNVEGLACEGNSPQLSTDNDETDGQVGGKTSPGPKEGLNTDKPTGDAAMKQFHIDVANRDARYQQVSRVVGAFDCKTMTAAELNVAAVAKLGLKNVPKGSESVALDAYFAGRKAATPAASTAINVAADSRAVAQPSSSITAFLNAE